MAESSFPADHFDRELVDDRHIPWSTDDVDEQIALGFRISRNPEIEEHVADLWDAAFYLIIAKLIWEGWLRDWKNWQDDSQNGLPDPDVPALLFEHCIDAVEMLTYAGVLRTQYVDESVKEILSRFPPNSQFEPWPEGWENDLVFYCVCCAKVTELIPLQEQLVRFQQHLETAPEWPLGFQIAQLGMRTVGNYPGTVLDVYVGYVPHGSEPTEESHGGVDDATDPTSANVPDAQSVQQPEVTVDKSDDAGNRVPPNTTTAGATEKKPKRSTEPGEAHAKLIAGLTAHHQYKNGSCLNWIPIGCNELAREAEVSNSTASEFFKAQFGRHSTYKTFCKHQTKLVASLQILNGEHTPASLFNRLPDEHEVAETHDDGND